MVWIKVPKQEGQAVKKFLMEKEWLDYSFTVQVHDDGLCFALSTQCNQKELENQFSSASFVELDIQPKEKAERDMKKALAHLMSAQEVEKLKTAYDIIGDIAVIEIDEGMEQYEQDIASFILTTQSNVKTILKKAGIHQGNFRTQEMAFLAGEDKRDTIHTENGVRLKMRVGKVYFSMRLSTDRRRIADLVQKNERVLVMFSGAGPYSVTIAKKSKAKEVIGVEWNPVGVELANESVRLNKLTNIKHIQGDVYKILPTLEGTFDRIMMPLPKSAGDFLDIALTKAHKGTILHLYDFLSEAEFHLAHKKIDDACKRANLKYNIIETVKCGNHAPYVYRICVDFEIQ